jgi:hypothetical protein
VRENAQILIHRLGEESRAVRGKYPQINPVLI